MSEWTHKLLLLLCAHGQAGVNLFTREGRA